MPVARAPIVLPTCVMEISMVLSGLTESPTVDLRLDLRFLPRLRERVTVRLFCKTMI